MKKEFSRKEHIEEHKKRIAQIRKNIRERKIIAQQKEKIKQRRKFVSEPEE